MDSLTPEEIAQMLMSALMSGVMLKTAIYGMVRVIYDLIGAIRWEWGLTVLLFGAAFSAG